MLGERAFAVSAPLTWNNLPRELKKLNALLLLNACLKLFHLNRRIFKLHDCVMRLRFPSRRRTQSHHVISRLLYFQWFYSF